MVKTVGLALGSGGARGWAHIGVIRALEEADITIGAIAGASIGALVGAVYAAGELDELEAIVRDLDWRSIVSYFDLVFPTSGLLDGNKVYELLSDRLQSLCIEEAAMPFCCIATDLATGKEVCIDQGPMVDAVRASISIPGIFTPFQKGDKYLGDGGIVNPVPVDAVRRLGPEVVLAVNLNRAEGAVTPEATIATVESTPSQSQDSSDLETSDAPDASEADALDPPEGQAAAQSPLTAPGLVISEQASTLINRLRSRYETMQEVLQNKLEGWLPEEKSGPNIFDVIGTSLNVMEQRVTQSQLAQYPPDLLLEPPLQGYSIFDFHQAADIIQMGYDCTQQILPDLKKRLE